MGDIIEFHTCHSESILYRVPKGGLKVDIKAISGAAAIGLKKRDDEDNINFWIVIGYENKTWIQKDEAFSQLVQTPRILSNDEYRSFWISWNSISISLGRDGEVDPIVSMTDRNTNQLNFVLFAVKGEMDSASILWKLELPPIIPNPELIPVTNGDVQWVRAENQLPDGALIGGYENGPLYIIRAYHNQSLTPGKGSHEGVGYIAWGSEARRKTNFEVLVGFNCTWVPAHDDKIPVGAIEGGYAEHTREKLYIGRVNHNGHVIPGKVQPSHAVCYIPYEGREIAYKFFEVLVAPNTNLSHVGIRRERCSNKLLRFSVDIDSPVSANAEQDDHDFVFGDPYFDNYESWDFFN